MPTLTRPLFGDSARGSIGKLLTYSNWNGRSYVRALGINNDRNSLAQTRLKNIMRALVAGVTWANHTTTIWPDQTETDKVRITALAQPAYPWNAYLIQAAIGPDLATYEAMADLWATFTEEQWTNWDLAAAALSPPMPTARQRGAGSGAAPPLSAGKVYFAYRYGLYALDLDTVPTGDPPFWAPPEEELVQQLQIASCSEYGWTVPTDTLTEIPGLTITMTATAEWWTVNARGLLYNWGGATPMLTFQIENTDEYLSPPCGPPLIVYCPAGKYVNFALDFRYTMPAGEHTFAVKALADVSGCQIYESNAIMSCHTMGF